MKTGVETDFVANGSLAAPDLYERIFEVERVETERTEHE